MGIYIGNVLYDSDDETFSLQVGLPGDDTPGDDRVTSDPVGTLKVVVGDQTAIGDLAINDVDAAAGEATAAALDDTNTNFAAIETKINAIIAVLEASGLTVVTP